MMSASDRVRLAYEAGYLAHARLAATDLIAEAWRESGAHDRATLLADAMARCLDDARALLGSPPGSDLARVLGILDDALARQRELYAAAKADQEVTEMGRVRYAAEVIKGVRAQIGTSDAQD